MPDLCRQLTARREQLGLTQADVGRSIGRDQRTISRWENGETCPDLQEANQWASALGLRLVDLLIGNIA